MYIVIFYFCWPSLTTIEGGIIKWADNVFHFLTRCIYCHFYLQPEDAKEAARDVLARAQAKGLLSSKKSKEKLEMNGEADSLTNGHDVDANESKLLHKRGKKAPRKLHQTSSAPHPPSYVKPSGVSPVASYINTAAMKWRRHSASTKSTMSGTSVGSRLFQSQTKVFSDNKLKVKPKYVSEHIKVVKHPAPFRWTLNAMWCHFSPPTDFLSPHISW